MKKNINNIVDIKEAFEISIDFWKYISDQPDTLEFKYVYDKF